MFVFLSVNHHSTTIKQDKQGGVTWRARRAVRRHVLTTRRARRLRRSVASADRPAASVACCHRGNRRAQGAPSSWRRAQA